MSEKKAIWWDLIMPSLLVIWAIIMAILIFNPFGLAQRIEWGMQPPYHWVYTHDSVDERYLVDANGKTCADLYYFDGQWSVYGYGFEDDNISKDAMIRVAERNCR